MLISNPFYHGDQGMSLHPKLRLKYNMVLLCLYLIYHPILIICGPIIPSQLCEKLHDYLDGGSSALHAELVHFFLSSLPL